MVLKGGVLTLHLLSMLICMTQSSASDRIRSHLRAQSTFKGRTDREHPGEKSLRAELAITSWEHEHEHADLCGKASSFTAGAFYATEHGDFVYEPEDCRLRRFSAEEARRCLSGRHLAFIGDSITRYQYLSFAYFLSKKRPLERHGDVEGSPALTWEKEWPSWEDFFKRGSAMLSSAVEGCSEEACDCRRDGAISSGQLQGHIREYRKFTLQFPFPCTVRDPSLPAEHLTLSFLVTFGQQVDSDVEAGIDLLRHVSKHIFQDPPTDIIYNEGAWFSAGSVDRMETYMHGITPEFKKFRQRHPGTNVIWKTTTLPQDGNGDNSAKYRIMEQAHAEGTGINITDAHAVTKALHTAGLAPHAYVDNLHFKPFVYEQLNDLLLNQMCN